MFVLLCVVCIRYGGGAGQNLDSVSMKRIPVPHDTVMRTPRDTSIISMDDAMRMIRTNERIAEGCVEFVRKSNQVSYLAVDFMLYNSEKIQARVPHRPAFSHCQHNTQNPGKTVALKHFTPLHMFFHRGSAILLSCVILDMTQSRDEGQKRGEEERRGKARRKAEEWREGAYLGKNRTVSFLHRHFDISFSTKGQSGIIFYSFFNPYRKHHFSIFLKTQRPILTI